MYFCHSQEIRRDFPELVAGVLLVEGVTELASVAPQSAKYKALAAARLEVCSEGEMPEIQAWRRAFSKMGLKPTQYRCASESLLRRFRKEGLLPQIHPLIDLCNSVSLAFAIPIAAFDISRISEYIEVRYAKGTEIYSTLAGEIENPTCGEVIFADSQGRAHARRWTNRQSGHSVVQRETTNVLIVTEAMHSSAEADVQKVITTIADEVRAIWSVEPIKAVLSSASRRFDFEC